MTYAIDRPLEDKFSEAVKGILGNFFIKKVEVDDLEKGVDFAVYRINPFSVAVRLRRYSFFHNFSDEFTIRYSRPSGTRTEIDKIRDRQVQYLFYGFLSQNQDRIIQYFIGDLNKFGTVQPFKIVPNNPPD